jgi:hypothetical protein
MVLGVTILSQFEHDNLMQSLALHARHRRVGVVVGGCIDVRWMMM